MGSNGKAGFVILPREIMELGPTIGSSALHVYAVLVDHADEDGVCWPSVRKMTEVSGMSESTVRRSLKALVRHSVISVEARTDNRRRTSNLYRLLITHEPPYENDRGGSQFDSPPLSNLPGPPCQKRKGDPVKNVRGIRTNEQDPLNKTQGTKAVSPEIPDGLRTDRFETAWGNWLSYRRERRLTVKPMTLKAQLRKLDGWGEASAAESIELSISNGWQGLFEPKPNGNGRPEEPQRELYFPAEDDQ